MQVGLSRCSTGGEEECDLTVETVDSFGSLLIAFNISIQQLWDAFCFPMLCVPLFSYTYYVFFLISKAFLSQRCSHSQEPLSFWRALKTASEFWETLLPSLEVRPIEPTSVIGRGKLGEVDLERCGDSKSLE